MSSGVTQILSAKPANENVSLQKVSLGVSEWNFIAKKKIVGEKIIVNSQLNNLVWKLKD